jgi:hypothetical protein
MYCARSRLVTFAWFSSLVALCTLAVMGLGERPAAAQYGPPPPPPPPPQGGYYRPAPQPYYYQAPPPPPGPQRRGFTIGGSLGLGGVSFEDTRGNSDDWGGFGMEGHIGGMITPQLGILLDGWLVVAAMDDSTAIAHNIGTVDLRYFIGRFWLQGGLGLAAYSISTCDSTGNYCRSGDSSETGGAFLVGAGLEIIQSPHLTMDLSLRLGAAGYSDFTMGMSSLLLGLNWY